jgi:hypothetical protein
VNNGRDNPLRCDIKESLVVERRRSWNYASVLFETRRRCLVHGPYGWHVEMMVVLNG